MLSNENIRCKLQIKANKIDVHKQVKSVLVICKWGGNFTHCGRSQTKKYVPVFWDEMLRPQPPPPPDLTDDPEPKFFKKRGSSPIRYSKSKKVSSSSQNLNYEFKSLILEQENDVKINQLNDDIVTQANHHQSNQPNQPNHQPNKLNNANDNDITADDDDSNSEDELIDLHKFPSVDIRQISIDSGLHGIKKNINYYN